MKNTNTWHEKQERTYRSRFKPKWTPDTIVSIISAIENHSSDVDIKYHLAKEYDISLASATLWLEMTYRVMDHMRQGSTLQEALDKDKEMRNEKRRVKDKNPIDNR